MILAFSTSSPLASVALLSPSGDVLKQAARQAPMAASGACLAMIEELEIDLKAVDLFLADLGPGSFTGVRVGVTLAKTFGFLNGARCGGASAFDLISATTPAALPSKRGECFVREPGQEPYRTEQRPSGELAGYGLWFPGEEATFPQAFRFGGILDRLSGVAPELLVPEYLIEPSISTPKRPFERITGG